MMQRGNGRYTRRAAVLAVVLLLVAVAPATVGANPILAWFFGDADPPGWGSTLPYWEWMDGPGPNGSVQGLDPFHPYYACTPVLTGNWSNIDLETHIWFANSYSSENLVIVQLRKGSWGNEGTVLAEDTLTVRNAVPTVLSYRSYFGFIPNLVFNDESLVVKLIYLGAPGDTHIYWNDPQFASMLMAGGSAATEPSTWGRIKALFRE